MSTAHAQQLDDLEISDALPEGWAPATLSDVCDINPPKPPADVLSPDTPVTFVPMPAVDADMGAITTPKTRDFTQVRKGFTAFREGDVIMAKITPCMENGKAARAIGLLNGYGFGSTEFHVLRPTEAIRADFVYHFIRQESYRKDAEAEMTGSVGQKRVPVHFIEQTEIALPPFDEQCRIVAKVEELLAHANTSHEHLAKVPKILKAFRQSVLAAACSGRLTEDWRKSHPEEKGFEDAAQDASLTDLPETWITSTVEGVSEAIVDCPHSTPKWRERGVICIRTTNFRPGLLDLSEVRYVSESTYQERIARLRPQEGDVLYSREGGILGIACRVPANTTLCLGQRMMLIRTSKTVLVSELLMHLLNSPGILARVNELTGGSASPHLNVGEIKRFPVPLPPLEEQHEIVRRVEALFKLADAIERRVAAATKRAEKLTQSILGKAFRGELVPTEAELARREGRPYEPASVLLDRIKIQRKSETPAIKRKRFSTRRRAQRNGDDKTK